MRALKTATGLLRNNPGDLLAKLKKSKRYNDQKQENPNNAANKTRRCSNLLDILRRPGTTFKEKAETELKANKDNTKKGKQIRGILDIIEDKPDIPKKKPHVVKAETKKPRVVKAETKKSKAIEKAVT